MNYQEALQLANEAIEVINSYVERVEIAGSLRRKKEEGIKDIELVVVPRVEKIDISTNLTGETMYEERDLLYEALSILPYEASFEDYPLQLGPPDKAGKKAPSGPKYYRLFFKNQRLDIFSVISPAQWGIVFLIRTGPADYSHNFVQMGWSKGLYFKDGALRKVKENSGKTFSQRLEAGFEKFEEIIPTSEEEDVYREMGLPFVPPEKRVL